MCSCSSAFSEKWRCHGLLPFSPQGCIGSPEKRDGPDPPPPVRRGGCEGVAPFPPRNPRGLGNLSVQEPAEVEDTCEKLLQNTENFGHNSKNGDVFKIFNVGKNMTQNTNIFVPMIDNTVSL